MQNALLLIVTITGIWAFAQVVQVRKLGLRLQRVRVSHVNKEQQPPLKG
jgi:hypothetical protein